jgi:hypothetical protein
MLICVQWAFFIMNSSANLHPDSFALSFQAAQKEYVTLEMDSIVKHSVSGIFSESSTTKEFIGGENYESMVLQVIQDHHLCEQLKLMYSEVIT